jgi:prepilin-type N-terminal cleavage/methylation domain-containing protein
MNTLHFTRAFSVTELMVVITIIGFLSLVAVGSYGAYRADARDAHRIATIEQVHLALKQYASVYGDLPDCSDAGYPGGCDLSSFGPYSENSDSSLDGQFLEVLVAAGYLPDNITDPLDDDTYFYAYGRDGEFPPSSGKFYDIFLITQLEDPTNPILQEDLNDEPGIENAYIITDNF